MVGKKRSLSIVVLVLFLLNIAIASAIITPVNPTNNAVIGSNSQLIFNITSFQNTNITAKLLPSTLIGYNASTGFVQYKIFFNISAVEDGYYNISINASNSTTYQNYTIRNVYVDSHTPNITSTTFNNTIVGKRVFNNGSQYNLSITIDENSTIQFVSANTTVMPNTTLTWNSSTDIWKTILTITGNLVSNNLKILVKDLANKTDIVQIPFFIDYEGPTIIANTIPNATDISSPTFIYTDNVIDINISDDTNISSYVIYLDDTRVSNATNEQDEYIVNKALNENVGYHNITIIATDIMNKTSTHEQLFYWWYGPSSTTYLHDWTLSTNNTNPDVTTVYFSFVIGETYSKINSQILPGASLCQNDACAISINSSNNYIEYFIPAGNFLEFNWNKTINVTFDNHTYNSDILMQQIEGNYTTTIKSLIYINEKINKTPFIRNSSKYAGIESFKGNFANTSLYTDIFYFPDVNDLQTKIRLNQSNSCPATEYLANSTTACYKVVNNLTKVYVPKMGIITANLDNIPPRITKNYPESTHNDSIGLNINFSTTEESICNATIKQGNITLYTLSMNQLSNNSFDTEFYYSFANTFFDNGDYNLTIGCKDIYYNSNTTIYTFTIYDSTKPEITIISPTATQYKTTNDNSYTVPISIATNEFCSKIYYTIGAGSDWTLIGENTTNTTATVRKATGTFLFRVYAIDYAGNGQEKSITFSVDASIATSDTITTSTKTTGIIVTDITNLTTTKTKSQTWYSIKEGDTKTLLLDNPLFDLIKIVFTPTRNISLLKITVKLLDKEPIKLPEDHKLYQVYQISELATNYSAESPEFTFRIKNSWINYNNIENVTISTYNNNWTDVEITKLGQDLTYTTYKTTLEKIPEYLAITGIPVQPIIEKPTITNITIDDNKTKQNNTPIINDDISETVPQKKNPIIPIIISILTIAGLFGAGLYSYKTIKIPVLKYEDLTKDEKTKIKEFISIRLSTGEPIHKIETELINKGWSQDIVDKITKTVNVPKRKEEELREFVEKMLKLHNISKSDIQQSLVNVGWQPEVIEEIMKEY
ncbi:hypothetical protein JXM83_05895 [Candidatus Woesearchaeota archaeon]|nr:hypothetical protein [Candidatus Woesearchaeota archaeon]